MRTIGARVVAAVLIAVVVGVVAVQAVPWLAQFGQEAPTIQQGITPTPEITRPMPATTTSCPTGQSPRPAVTAPLKLGTQNTLFYRDTTPTSYLASYNTATRQSKKLLEASSASEAPAFSSPQVSADGKWLVFERTSVTAETSVQPGPIATQIQMMRADGQGLQTLFCPSGRNPYFVDNGDLALSPHAQRLAFHLAQDASATTSDERDDLYVLDLLKGQLKDVLPYREGVRYMPLQWLDDNQLYLLHTVGQTSQEIMLLNVRQGSIQQVVSPGELGPIDTSQGLPASMPAPHNWLMALNSDHTKLYVATSSGITVRPVQGGAPTTLYSLKDGERVTQLVASKSDILFQSTPASSSKGTPGWTTWRLQSDNPTPQEVRKSQYIAPTQFTLSLDGKWLAFNAYILPGSYEFRVKPLDGGSEGVVASINTSRSGAIPYIGYGGWSLVGWTSL